MTGEQARGGIEYEEYQQRKAAYKSSLDRQRTSPISAVEVLDAALVLQGHQNGCGLTMVVERVTGHLSATVTDAEGVFVIAGGCTAQ